MDIVRFSLNALPPREEGLGLALGFFDGVHLGHQALFRACALESRGPSAALFLDSCPFKGEEKECLTPLEEKCRLAASMRLDKAYILETDSRFFSLSPKEFIDSILAPLGTELVVVGEDYRFGKGASGTIEDLRAHFKTIVAPTVLQDGEKVSTTRIKELLKEGNVEKAASMLGRPYEIAGKVVHGKELGRTIGFPTANLAPSARYVLPKEGIYAGLTYVRGIPHLSIVNVGKNPTFGGLDEPLVESHMLDFDGDCYDATVYIAFLRRGRDERKFASKEELADQLAKDSAWARSLKL